MNSFNKLDPDKFELIPNRNHLLDLINGYPRISEKYSTQTKRNLKKANKSSLTLMKNIKPEAVIDLFRENRGKTLTKWKDKHYIRLKRLIYAAVHKGSGVVYGVFTAHNELCAGAIFIRSNNRLIFLFSGVNEQGRENAAMTYLIDGVIKEHAPSQTVFDFEGSNDPNLARFYQGFGAKEIEYYGLRINRMGFPAKQLFAFYQKIKKQ